MYWLLYSWSYAQNLDYRYKETSYEIFVLQAI